MEKLELSFEDAVEVAAKQNFLCDKLNGVFEGKDDFVWSNVAEAYIAEARYMLETSGENYVPEHDDLPHIVLKK